MNSHCYSVTEQNWMSSASYKCMHRSKKGYSNRLLCIHGFSDFWVFKTPFLCEWGITYFQRILEQRGSFPSTKGAASEQTGSERNSSSSRNRYWAIMEIPQVMLFVSIHQMARFGLGFFCFLKQMFKHVTSIPQHSILWFSSITSTCYFKGGWQKQHTSKLSFISDRAAACNPYGNVQHGQGTASE